MGKKSTSNPERGPRISALIARKGINQKELAKSIDLSESALSQIIKGETNPTVEHLYQISKYFKVSMEFIETGRDILAKYDDNNTLQFSEMGIEELEFEVFNCLADINKNGATTNSLTKLIELFAMFREKSSEIRSKLSTCMGELSKRGIMITK